jgi:threonine dehydrogenase-like Zn-dependent dehydrogenase
MHITLKDVRDNWVIIAACGSLGLAAITAHIRQGYAAEEVKVLKTEVTEVKKEITTIRIEATRVATSAEEQRRATERQIDQLIQAVERIREPR